MAEETVRSYTQISMLSNIKKKIAQCRLSFEVYAGFCDRKIGSNHRQRDKDLESKMLFSQMGLVLSPGEPRML